MEFAITHISTACVLLEIGSLRILTDPIFDTGRKRYRFLPGIHATRRLDPAMSAESLPPLDAVLLSHPHHADNLDEGGRAVLARAREIVTFLRLRQPVNQLAVLARAREIVTGSQKAGSLGRPVTALRDWSQTTLFGRDGERVSVTAIPAQHGPRWLPGVRHVRGFALEWEGQKDGVLYISGDTVFFDELGKINHRFQVGTALLHLGAVNFWPPLPPWWRFTMNAAEAVRTTSLLAPRTVIPIHYEQSVWSHFKEDVATYERAFRDAGLRDRLLWLERGQRTTLAI